MKLNIYKKNYLTIVHPQSPPAGASRKYSERRRSEPTASRVWTHQKLAEHSKDMGAQRPIEKIINKINNKKIIKK